MLDRASLAARGPPLLEAAPFGRLVPPPLQGARVQTMDLYIALGLLAASVGLTVFCGWMGARPPNFAKPRLINWQLLMLASAAFVLVTIVHLVNVLGVTTGVGH
jgi:type III secretory pathway component EscS